jgi:threonine synthase
MNCGEIRYLVSRRIVPGVWIAMIRGTIMRIEIRNGMTLEKSMDILDSMTLEEAIEHAREVAHDKGTCAACAAEHEQLAQWLEELKERRRLQDNIVALLTHGRKEEEA